MYYDLALLTTIITTHSVVAYDAAPPRKDNIMLFWIMIGLLAFSCVLWFTPASKMPDRPARMVIATIIVLIVMSVWVFMAFGGWLGTIFVSLALAMHVAFHPSASLALRLLALAIGIAITTYLVADHGPRLLSAYGWIFVIPVSRLIWAHKLAGHESLKTFYRSLSTEHPDWSRLRTYVEAVSCRFDVLRREFYNVQEGKKDIRHGERSRNQYFIALMLASFAWYYGPSRTPLDSANFLIQGVADGFDQCAEIMEYGPDLYDTVKAEVGSTARTLAQLIVRDVATPQQVDSSVKSGIEALQNACLNARIKTGKPFTDINLSHGWGWTFQQAWSHIAIEAMNTTIEDNPHASWGPPIMWLICFIAFLWFFVTAKGDDLGEWIAKVIPNIGNVFTLGLLTRSNDSTTKGRRSNK